MLDEIHYGKVGVHESIFVAIKYGIQEVVEEVLTCLPQVYWISDDKNRTLFSHAIMERQVQIFKFLNTNTKKHALALNKDYGNNNLLLQAANLPSSAKIENQASGEALQMQRELQWFKEVKKIVKPRDMHKRNDLDKTPEEIFTADHKDLVRMGEKWMKDNATACSVVAALVITIMFGAIFVVPGGIEDKTGTPSLSNMKLLSIFLISDTLSLLSSAVSVVVFLGILTSTYRAEDFLKSLPTKLMIGLGTLFFSIVTMMIVFGTTFVFMIHHDWGSVTYPIVVLLACLPVAVYALLTFPLLIEIFLSTYGFSSFRRPKGNQFFVLWR